MDKKVVLITGASCGIGAQMAKVFAQNGYSVIINYNKSKDKAEALADELFKQGLDVLAYKADVSDVQQVKEMVKYALDVYGHIDVLINNAGVSSYNILIDESIDSITKTINTNLLGTIIVSKCVCEHMIKRQSGKIINISSIWGVVGGCGESVYSASKGGIIAFTKALAKELAPSNITVNSIAPGIVETDMINHLSSQEKEDLKQEIPLSRFASPKEIADVALFLASPKANYITGQTIQVDGGFSN